MDTLLKLAKCTYLNNSVGTLNDTSVAIYNNRKFHYFVTSHKSRSCAENVRRLAKHSSIEDSQCYSGCMIFHLPMMHFSLLLIIKFNELQKNHMDRYLYLESLDNELQEEFGGKHEIADVVTKDYGLTCASFRLVAKAIQNYSRSC